MKKKNIGKSGLPFTIYFLYTWNIFSSERNISFFNTCTLLDSDSFKYKILDFMHVVNQKQFQYVWVFICQLLPTLKLKYHQSRDGTAAIGFVYHVSLCISYNVLSLGGSQATDSDNHPTGIYYINSFINIVSGILLTGVSLFQGIVFIH